MQVIYITEGYYLQWVLKELQAQAALVGARVAIIGPKQYL